MFLFTESEAGQATLEAAFILPVMLAIVGMLLQPVCYLYSQSILAASATEASRLLVQEYQEEDIKAFVQRRLKSIPAVSIFHSGGDSDWNIELNKNDLVATVHIIGHIQGLPVLGISLIPIAEHDNRGFVLEVSINQDISPAWREGNYDDWIGRFKDSS